MHNTNKHPHIFWKEIEVAVSVAQQWGVLYQGSNWDGRWKGEWGLDNRPHKFLAAVQLYPAASTTSWTPITAGKAWLVREPVTPLCQQEIAKSKTMCDVLWCLSVCVCMLGCMLGCEKGKMFWTQLKKIAVPDELWPLVYSEILRATCINDAYA